MSKFKLTDEWERGARELLPSHMIGGWLRYWNDRIEPGGFLRAVLENDLIGALGRADATNISCLKKYGECLYWYAPGRPTGWGSPEAVKKWLSEEKR